MATRRSDEGLVGSIVRASGRLRAAESGGGRTRAGVETEELILTGANGDRLRLRANARGIDIQNLSSGNVRHIQMAPMRGEISLLGDSIIAGTFTPGVSWGDLLPATTTNHGVGGQPALIGGNVGADSLRVESLDAGYGVDGAVIAIGTNDCLGQVVSSDEVIAEIKSLERDIIASGTFAVWVATVPPFGPYQVLDGARYMAQEINAGLRAEYGPRNMLLDVEVPLLADDGHNADMSLYFFDGIHPTEDGSRAVAEWLVDDMRGTQYFPPPPAE